METERKNIVHIISYSILGIAIIGLIWWIAVQYNRTQKMNAILENQYNRAFFELVDYVDDIDTSLYKSMLTNSPAQMATVSSDIFRKSASAKACLGQLPISDIEMDNTSKFLSQVGDYTYVLSQNMIKDKTITAEDYQNLESLKNYATNLTQSLVDMQNSIYSGEVSFISGSGKNRFTKTVEAAGADIMANMENVEKDFQSYPSLIYDGPFSEHIETSKPVMLENTPEITQDAALQKAKDFLGNRGNNLTFESDTQNSAIDAYTFSSDTDGRQISISLTKKGGYVIYFLDNRNVEGDNINFETAIASAADFLQSKGFASMKNSYYDKSNGVATINFAYVENGITCYSDLVKVRVALDNGEILGMECKGYIMSHKQRNTAPAKLTKDEAKKRINPRLAIESETMSIIPKDSMREVLCYEFQGKWQDRKFIIYINADTGEEEKILMLIESDDGILTM